MQAYLLDDFKVEIDPRSVEIGAGWISKPGSVVAAAWGMDELKFFFRRITEYESPVVLDIGASGGSFSLLAAIHRNMRCYAFEPTPLTYEILNRNVVLNNLQERVKTFQLALADKNGTAVLKYPSSGTESGLACIGKPLRFDKWVEFKVCVSTVDDFVAEHGIERVDLLKIDTEGCELQVLRGAQVLISRWHPNIICECLEINTRQFGYHPKEIIGFLSSLGYEYTKVSPRDMYFYQAERANLSGRHTFAPKFPTSDTDIPAQRLSAVPLQGSTSKVRPEETGIKVALVKQVLDVFGPWSSVRWKDTTPMQLFSVWPGKASLWEMTCLLQADWYIVGQRRDMDYTRNAVFNCPGREQVIRRHTINVVKPYDIPFDRYDVIITLDPILDVPENSETLFAYYLNEHWDRLYKQSLQKPLGNYDLCLAHMMDAGQALVGLPQTVSFPLLRDSDRTRAMFPAQKQDTVFVDWRTLVASSNTQLWTEAARTAAEKLQEEISLPVSYKEYCRESFGFSDPPRWEDAARYLEVVSGCKYYLSVGRYAGAGQGICDAASLGCICIGEQDKVYHRLVCHPACLCADKQQMTARLKRVADSPELQEEVLAWQDQMLHKHFVEKPLELLRGSVNLKRKSSALYRTSAQQRHDFKERQQQPMPQVKVTPQSGLIEQGLRRNTLLNNSKASKEVTKFLGRNQYAIWFSNRCNYKCSYCCNGGDPKSPPSVVEGNTDAIIKLFDMVQPGVILLSGGEPALWKDFPSILEALPQHYWVLLTNLSFIPNWIAHPNIKLIIPAYHDEFADEFRFVKHAEDLREIGKRVHVKILVKQEQEYKHVHLWERFNQMAIPASLTPLWGHKYTKSFLRNVVRTYRTSCLYNARFFRRGRAADDFYCVAGTRKAFQVNPDGTLVRCSSIHDKLGSVFSPGFDDGKFCTGACLCEWHFWGGMTLVNDNDTWNHYLETGNWKVPSREELHQFVVGMRWNLSGNTIEDSQESLFDMHSDSKSVYCVPKKSLGDAQHHTQKTDMHQVLPVVTIFAVPKPFEGHTGVIQRNAIKSWSLLEPLPEIILLGDDAGTAELAKELGIKHIPQVKWNEYGTPLVNELFEKAQNIAVNDILCYVNADIVLTSDFMPAVQQVRKRFEKFLMVGQRWNVDVGGEIDFGQRDWQEQLKHLAFEYGRLHAPSGIDYFVFTRGLWPTIPPFGLGRRLWDNWLVRKPIEDGHPVVDATNVVTTIHQNHPYTTLSHRAAEEQMNLELGENDTSLGWTSHASWKLTRSGVELRPVGDFLESSRVSTAFACLEYAHRQGPEEAAKHCEETFASWTLEKLEGLMKKAESYSQTCPAAVCSVGKALKARKAIEAKRICRRGLDKLRTDEPCEALRLFDEALSLCPQVENVRFAKRVAESMVEAGRTQRHLVAKGLCGRGLERLRAGNPPEALVRFDEALLICPDLPNVHFAKATAFTQLGKFGSAKQACQTELALQPNHDGAKRLLGRVEAALNEFAQIQGSIGTCEYTGPG